MKRGATDIAADAGDSPRVTPRGDERRQKIIEATAALVRELGPSAVTHRAVASRAGCSLSATTYYFSSLEDLLHQAGRVNISRWASRAERVAERVEEETGRLDVDDRIEHLLDATLPKDETMIGHYGQLISAGASDPVSRAYRTGRSRLNTAVGRVLTHLGVALPADLVIAVVDGAAVSALSEGLDVRETARKLLLMLAEVRCANDQ
ncbi:TetR/AcrR family transcriptional regulator [Schaalia suimastitidis]|uniref:TetR/AcrR family transcriptional regulator n=1 Tax=Schaalia suimastitidis TaxID=121163 RepID=UPI0006863618|nr:TetR family transcriptional regulator [Schaalia suimastitidis]